MAWGADPSKSHNYEVPKSEVVSSELRCTTYHLNFIILCATSTGPGGHICECNHQKKEVPNCTKKRTSWISVIGTELIGIQNEIYIRVQ